MCLCNWETRGSWGQVLGSLKPVRGGIHGVCVSVRGHVCV